MTSSVRIGEKDLRVLPLNLGSMKKLAAEGHLEKLQTFNSGLMSAEHIASVVAIISAALIRSYPEATEPWVEDNLTIDQLGDVLNAVLEASGFKAKSASPNAVSP